MDEKVVYALEPTEALSTETLEQLKGETKKDDKERNTAAVARHTQTWLAWSREAGGPKTDTILAYETQNGSERGSNVHRRQDNPTKHNGNRNVTKSYAQKRHHTLLSSK